MRHQRNRYSPWFCSPPSAGSPSLCGKGEDSETGALRWGRAVGHITQESLHPHHSGLPTPRYSVSEGISSPVLVAEQLWGCKVTPEPAEPSKNVLSVFMKELWVPDGKKRVGSALPCRNRHCCCLQSSHISAFLLCSFSYMVSRDNTEDRETPASCRITEVDVIIFS